jgi:chemotaxis protein methyltransferase CheR
VVALFGDEWKLLAQYIHSICGIQLDESKRYLIESRLSGLLEQTASLSYTGLYQKARMDATGTLERSIINAITTGESSFFRDDSPFQLLRHKILPDLIDSRSRTAAGKIPIRIWSAACSTGQEVYSIAIVLREALGGSEKYDVRLTGTDISPDAVRRASLGVYNSVEAGRGLDAGKLSRYFTKQDGNWKVRDEIRAMASFRTVNLLRDFSALGQFDIIFCRNVAIYFSDRDKASLFGRMEKSLASDGYLIVGATESLAGVCPQFTAKNHLRAVFYQRGG